MRIFTATDYLRLEYTIINKPSWDDKCRDSHPINTKSLVPCKINSEKGAAQIQLDVKENISTRSPRWTWCSKWQSKAKTMVVGSVCCLHPFNFWPPIALYCTTPYLERQLPTRQKGSIQSSDNANSQDSRCWWSGTSYHGIATARADTAVVNLWYAMF